MSTDGGGGGGGGGSLDYSPARLETVTDEIEELLADLMGIETAARTVRDYFASVRDEPGVAPAPKKILLNAAKPFHVYPVLPAEEVGADGEKFGWDTWINGAYDVGAGSAAGNAAWLRSIADNYYLVDTGALISGANTQGDLVLQQGTQLDEDLADVSSTLAVHWEGDAKDEFFHWFPLAYGVVGALLQYANAAQVCVGACGDAIGATQQALLRQAESARDTLQGIIQAWHDDFDAFPFPPGSGWKFKEIGTALQGKIDQYTQHIPGPDWIIDTAESAATGKIISKIPGAAQVVKTNDLLTALESSEKDVGEQKTAQQVLDLLETAFRGIVKEGDDTLHRLESNIATLAAEVEGADILVLQRLPRDPQGSYDPSA